MSLMPELNLFTEIDSLDNSEFVSNYSQINLGNTNASYLEDFPEGNISLNNCLLLHNELNLDDSFDLTELNLFNDIGCEDKCSLSPVYDFKPAFTNSDSEEYINELCSPDILLDNNPSYNLSHIECFNEDNKANTEVIKPALTKITPGPASTLSNLESQCTLPGLSKELKGKPIKIIVKKVERNKNIPSKMVAPVIFPETSNTFLEIPSCSYEMTSQKISYLRRGGKLKPQENTDRCSNKAESFPNKPGHANKILNKHSNLKSKKVIKFTKPLLNLQNLPFTSLKRRHSFDQVTRQKKIKAYELDPLPDPNLEKCRRNAINAKKNRELQKAKMVALEKEIEVIKQKNLKLAGENEHLKTKQVKMEEQLKSLSELLTDPAKLLSLMKEAKQFNMNHEDRLNGI